MKILLVRVKKNRSMFLHETNITGIYPPLGLAYIASILKNAGYNVEILDLEISNLKTILGKNVPDVILFTATTLIWPDVVWTASLMKQHFADVLIGVGGPHVSAYPALSLANEVIDFGIYGEGEKTILEVLERIKQKQGLDDVKGCVFKKNGKTAVNPPRLEIEDLDSIPFPAIDLLPYRKYFAFTVKHPFFTIVTSRGCPFKCKFCYQGYLGKYRFRSPENVVEEIEIYLKKYGIKEIIIFDETFAVEKKRVLRICSLINKKKLKFMWDVRTRIDLLDEEILQSLKRAGCYRLNFGIELGDQKILDKMDKGFSLKNVKEKVKQAKKIGFKLRGYFMLAYPGETYESILKTINLAKTLPLDWASFTITIGLPETEIYKRALEEGYFHVDYWKEYTKGNILNTWPNFIPDGLKEEDLYRLKRKAYREFYFRSGIIWSMTRELKLVSLVKNSAQVVRLLPHACRSLVK